MLVVFGASGVGKTASVRPMSAPRLAERGQADLHTPQMDAWAACLRGQADALELAVIDTSYMSVDQAADRLASAVAVLQGMVAGLATQR